MLSDSRNGDQVGKGDFSLEYVARSGARYREPGRSMFVDAEMAPMPHGLILFAGSIVKWDPPYEGEPLDQNARYRIICNIQEYMSRKGFDIIVDTGRSKEEYLTPTWDQIRRENRPK